MPRVNGVDITQPESNRGGGFTGALMGIFRDRTRAQQQLQMMAYGSALDVASKAAEVEVTSDVSRKALAKDFKMIYSKHKKDVYYPDGHEKAGQLKHKAGDYKNPELASHVSEAGLESTPYGYKFSPSSLTKAEMMRRGVGPFEQYSAPTGGATTTSGPTKGKKKSAPVETPAPTMPVVNEAPQTVAQPNVGIRQPAPSKGGFKQPTLPGMGKVSRTPKKPTPPATGGLGMGDMPNA